MSIHQPFVHGQPIYPGISLLNQQETDIPVKIYMNILLFCGCPSIIGVPWPTLGGGAQHWKYQYYDAVADLGLQLAS